MKLPRRNCPLEVQCEVASRQLAKAGRVAPVPDKPLRVRLRMLLDLVAKHYGCDPQQLRRDHDPALALRDKIRDPEGRIVGYLPDENDPRFMLFRPQGAQFDDSHHTKTYLRGERGQFSDTVLIKRQRRREKAERGEEKKKRPIQGMSRWAKGRKIESRGFERRKL